MALCKVTGPDGETYEVEAPEGTTKAQIIAAVESSLNKERRTEAQQDYFDYLAQIYAKEKEEEIETGLLDQGEELIKGVVGGVTGLAETAALGAITPLPESAELTLRKGIQALGDLGEEYIYGADEGSENLVGRKFGEALGSFGGILAGTLVNPFLGVGLAVGAGAGEASEERARAEMLQQVNVLEPLLLVPSLARLNLSLQCVLLGSSSRGLEKKHLMPFSIA